MKCVILQPSYIPWRGYFHQIALADTFVFYDDVQYDTHGWRNRNRLKTRNGVCWMTIPVLHKGAHTEHTPINQIRINWERSWNEKHWSLIYQSYNRAPYFERYAPLLQDFYQQHPDWLVDITIPLTIALARELGIQHTQFIRSSSLDITGSKTDRLINLLQTIGADHYISGPSARDYIENEKFAAAGITLEYVTYGYPEYPQLYPPYDPQVSILDLLFMTGPDALQLILGEWNS